MTREMTSAGDANVSLDVTTAAAESEVGDEAKAGGAGEEENVRVYLRLRPMNKLEISRRSTNCVHVHEDSQCVTVDSPLDGEFEYLFDKVFEEETSQTTVYEEVGAPIASRLVMDGMNCALLAYGQTGTGKTHTMTGLIDGSMLVSPEQSSSNPRGMHHLGSDSDDPSNPSTMEGLTAEGTTGDAGSSVEPRDWDRDIKQAKKMRRLVSMQYEEDELSGMVPRVFKDIFYLMTMSRTSTEFTVRCSFVEVYMEKLADLLNPQNRNLRIVEDEGKSGNDKEHSSPNVHIQGLSEVCCFDESDLLALLIRGNAHRQTSATMTQSGDLSSRSHAIFILTIEKFNGDTGSTTVSKLHLVDMAGSELATKHKGQKGNGRMRSPQHALPGGISTGSKLSPQEAKMVNRSLTALNNVVRSFHEQGSPANKCDSSVGGSTIKSSLSGTRTSASPHKQSKLTRILRNVFGGNCVTAVVLTASGSSYGISETLATMRFGQRCRRIQNRTWATHHLLPSMYEKQLQSFRRERTKIIDMAMDLASDIRQLDDKGSLGGERDSIILKVDNMSKVFEKEGECSENASSGAKSIKLSRISERRGSTSSDNNEGHAEDLEAELEQLKTQLQMLSDARDHEVSELQSEVAMLRTQVDKLTKEKMKTEQDLVDVRCEADLLHQRKREVEQSLQTSQFREHEATVFLRHFRKFYRRLRTMAVQGNGEVQEVTAKIPGAPNLTDLVDIDLLMLEAGFLEEDEVGNDTAGGSYEPSSEALVRSTAAANLASKEADAIMEAESEKPEEGEESPENDPSPPKNMPLRKRRSRFFSSYSADEGDVSSIAGDSAVGDDKSQDDNSSRSGLREQFRKLQRSFRRSNTAVTESGDEASADAGAGVGVRKQSKRRAEALLPRMHETSAVGEGQYAPIALNEQQKTLQTPSGRLALKQEREVEADLLRLTERCIQLQVALDDARGNIELMAHQKMGSLNEKKMGLEIIRLQQILENKANDQQAIVWKMNELNLVNKSLTEQMSDRSLHLSHLETSLSDLQQTNGKMLSSQQETERKLRDEVFRLKGQLTDVTTPLWQFGEADLGSRNLVESTRIIIPFRGGDRRDPVPSTLLAPSDEEASADISLDDKGDEAEANVGSADPISEGNNEVAIKGVELLNGVDPKEGVESALGAKKNVTHEVVKQDDAVSTEENISCAEEGSIDNSQSSKRSQRRSKQGRGRKFQENEPKHQVASTCEKQDSIDEPVASAKELSAPKEPVDLPPNPSASDGGEAKTKVGGGDSHYETETSSPSTSPQNSERSQVGVSKRKSPVPPPYQKGENRIRHEEPIQLTSSASQSQRGSPVVDEEKSRRDAAARSEEKARDDAIDKRKVVHVSHEDDAELARTVEATLALAPPLSCPPRQKEKSPMPSKPPLDYTSPATHRTRGKLPVFQRKSEESPASTAPVTCPLPPRENVSAMPPKPPIDFWSPSSMRRRWNHDGDDASIASKHRDPARPRLPRRERNDRNIPALGSKVMEAERRLQEELEKLTSLSATLSPVPNAAGQYSSHRSFANFSLPPYKVEDEPKREDQYVSPRDVRLSRPRKTVASDECSLVSAPAATVNFDDDGNNE